MQFDFNFYSSLLLIFVANGLLYSILLVKKAIYSKQNSFKWLGLFVLLCCLYLMPWMFGFAGWYDKQPYRDLMFYIPFQQLFFIGPVLYFYVQSLLNPGFNVNKANWIHFLPGIIYIVYSLIIVVTDKLVVHKYYFLADGTDRDFDPWYQYCGFVSMVFYLVITLKYYKKFVLLMQNLLSNADTLLFSWIKTFLISFLLMQLLQVLFFILGFFFNIETYVGSWWYFFCFAIIMYYIALSGYNNNLQTQIPFQFSKSLHAKAVLLPSVENEVAVEIDLNERVPFQQLPDDLLQYKSQLISLFASNTIAQNPDVTLAEIAKKLNSNSTVISKVINQGFQMNFNDFVNQHRIELVKKAFLNGEHNKSTLLGIAFDCGFNSKATFNRAFKKNTGLSPKNFIESI